MKFDSLNYIDSSVILSYLFEEEKQDIAEKFLNSPNNFTSKLTIAETFNNLNKLKPKLSESMFYEKFLNLQLILETMFLRNIDDSIFELMKLHFEISKLKTLDAIHFTTFLYYKIQTNSKIIFISFDKNLNQLVSKFGYETEIPKEFWF